MLQADGVECATTDTTTMTPLKNLQEMFQGKLDSDVVNMVFSECDFNVELTLETLFALVTDEGQKKQKNVFRSSSSSSHQRPSPLESKIKRSVNALQDETLLTTSKQNLAIGNPTRPWRIQNGWNAHASSLQHHSKKCSINGNTLHHRHGQVRDNFAAHSSSLYSTACSSVPDPNLTSTSFPRCLGNKQMNENNSKAFHVKKEVTVESSHRFRSHASEIDDIIQRIFHREKVLIILRGLPGSGKTTFAQKIKFEGVVLSTDDYFVKNGAYKFDSSRLSEAHDWNKMRARNCMEKGTTPVIIDNTNTETWEMKPYVALGAMFLYSIYILEPPTPWRFNIKELLKYNIHGVPKEKLKLMLERYDHHVTVDNIMSNLNLNAGCKDKDFKDFGSRPKCQKQTDGKKGVKNGKLKSRKVGDANLHCGDKCVAHRKRTNDKNLEKRQKREWNKKKSLERLEQEEGNNYLIRGLGERNSILGAREDGRNAIMEEKDKVMQLDELITLNRQRTETSSSAVNSQNASVKDMMDWMPDSWQWSEDQTVIHKKICENFVVEGVELMSMVQEDDGSSSSSVLSSFAEVECDDSEDDDQHLKLTDENDPLHPLIHGDVDPNDAKARNIHSYKGAETLSNLAESLEKLPAYSDFLLSETKYNANKGSEDRRLNSGLFKTKSWPLLNVKKSVVLGLQESSKSLDTLVSSSLSNMETISYNNLQGVHKDYRTISDNMLNWKSFLLQNDIPASRKLSNSYANCEKGVSADFYLKEHLTSADPFSFVLENRMVHKGQKEPSGSTMANHKRLSYSNVFNDSNWNWDPGNRSLTDVNQKLSQVAGSNLLKGEIKNLNSVISQNGNIGKKKVESKGFLVEKDITGSCEDSAQGSMNFISSEKDDVKASGNCGSLGRIVTITNSCGEPSVVNVDCKDASIGIMCETHENRNEYDIVHENAEWCNRIQNHISVQEYTVPIKADKCSDLLKDGNELHIRNSKEEENIINGQIGSAISNHVLTHQSDRTNFDGFDGLALKNCVPLGQRQQRRKTVERFTDINCEVKNAYELRVENSSALEGGRNHSSTWDNVSPKEAALLWENSKDGANTSVTHTGPKPQRSSKHGTEMIKVKEFETSEVICSQEVNASEVPPSISSIFEVEKTNEQGKNSLKRKIAANFSFDFVELGRKSELNLDFPQENTEETCPIGINTDTTTQTDPTDFLLFQQLANDGSFSDPPYKILIPHCTYQQSHESIPGGISVPLKSVLLLEKGTSTDDIPEILSQEEKKEFLKNTFPDISSDDLKDILEKCHGDVSWAVNILLDFGYDYNKGDQVNEINQLLLPREINNVMNVENMHTAEPSTKGSVHSAIISGNTIDGSKEKESENHLLTPQLEADASYLASVLDAPVEKGKLWNKNTGEGFDTSNDIDNGNKKISLKLDPAFAVQLETLFGPVGFHVSPDAYTDEHLTVKMEMDLAYRIYKQWFLTQTNNFKTEDSMESVIIKGNRNDRISGSKNVLLHAAQNESTSTAWEDEFPLLEDAENYFQGSSIKSTSQVKNEKLKTLQEIFPHMELQILEDVLINNDYYVPRAVADIEEMQGSPVDVYSYQPKADAQNSRSFSVVARKRKEMKLAEGQKDAVTSNNDDGGDDSADDFEVKTADGYNDFRAEAKFHYCLRQEYFQKAEEAYRQGLRAAASYYSEQGHMHSEKLMWANKRAAERILQWRNSDAQPNMLDLHGLHVQEALDALVKFLIEKQLVLKQSSLSKLSLCVITGRGKRSMNGVARIRPAIQQHLRQYNYKFEEISEGVFKIILT